MTIEKEHNENCCFLCLEDNSDNTTIDNSDNTTDIIVLNCCKTHQIHKSCLYNALLYYFSEINTKTMPCPICRKLIILKDYFTYEECNEYFALMPENYQKRFFRKHTILLKCNFTHTVIDINEDEQTKKIGFQDFTFMIIILILFILIIASSMII